ncbi:General substrate transporter [Cynara cardunculus var. scolymus]|uniref:General substrate transporter n=1 Tax=Cynara cardunculus var. scolymus TaxID=59895 RepID=A0A103XLN2_CYNCS|nr:General substrate transporter [Cynara cardunculus var. scolymus]
MSAATTATAAVYYPRLTPLSGICTVRTLNTIPCAKHSIHRPFRPLTCSAPGDFNFKAYGAKKSEIPEVLDFNSEKESLVSEEQNDHEIDLGWLPAFPHTLVASMSNFLFGFHIGVMNGPIVSTAKELGFEGNSILEGIVVSMFIAGAFLGSAGAGYMVDRLGFRRTLQVDTVPLILGAVLSAQAHSLDQLLWGRFFVGLGIGANAVLVPIYISEVAPTKYRGSLGSLCQIGTCTGIIASLFLGIYSENDPHWWRAMLYIASVPGFILALGMQFAVESPRWLCKAGKLHDAREVISNLWGPSEVERSIEEFQSVLNNDGGDLDSRWSELLEEPHSRVAFIGGTLFVLQQFAGINAVLYFSSLTFKDAGITNGALASLYVGITNFAGALCALYLIDTQGRQKLITGSYLGMAMSMFLVVSAISFPINEELRNNLSIFGTILLAAAGHVCNFLVGLFFLELMKNFGVAPVYASFGIVSLLAAFFSLSFLVETKGRSFEEIEMSLDPKAR